MENEILNEVTRCKGKIFKRISKTNYKYVYIVSYDGIRTYRAELAKYGYSRCFANIHEAALSIDKELLKNGKEPINILKRR